MSEKFKQVLAAIIEFIRSLREESDRRRHEVVMVESFLKDLEAEEKKNPGFTEDFHKFYRAFDERRPRRGSNIYGTGADKEEMSKGRKFAAYRIIYFHDQTRGRVIFLKLYPKDDEHYVFQRDGKRKLKQVVAGLKHDEVKVIPRC